MSQSHLTHLDAYPLRLVRGTTGTVHAGREVQREIKDFSIASSNRGTGKFRTELWKACGFDPNTIMSRTSGVGVETDVEITCKRCLKALA
jgi:hypothetical protein